MLVLKLLELMIAVNDYFCSALFCYTSIKDFSQYR